MKYGHTDDIDNLSNRRVRGVGELLLMQIKAGLSKMGKMVKEKMKIKNYENINYIIDSLKIIYNISDKLELFLTENENQLTGCFTCNQSADFHPFACIDI